ncbi:hypothetical protein [Planosporangium flavigriseum]|uniref:hypothetical protein n=1 Tax=Planosporangium flavigriseum TaxID=373681 RepID=UPI0019522F09|nr:hypothetical protein [Planosporangium flavigriseum]
MRITAFNGKVQREGGASRSPPSPFPRSYLVQASTATSAAAATTRPLPPQDGQRSSGWPSYSWPQVKQRSR